MYDSILDILYHFLHLSIIVINVFGWVFKNTRKLNLAMLLLTFFSWFGLSFWFGVGYCPITDWHWQLKDRMGETNIPTSYIKYMVDKFFNIDSPTHLIDGITLGVFVLALTLSIIFNIRDRVRKRP